MKNKSTIILTFLCILSSCVYIFDTNYKNNNTNVSIQVANKSDNIPIISTTTTTEQTTQTRNNAQTTSNLNRININTADLNTLDTLPGIGQSIATSIIDYRTNVSLFKNIEDIKNVDGIGDKKFDKIKHLITVN